MRAWGATDEDIYKYREENQQEQEQAALDVEVYTENQEAIEIFLNMTNQWDLQPMTGQRLGLKWPSLEIAIRNHPGLVELKSKEHADVFRDIQTMEIAAIVELRNQERERKENE